MYPNTFRSIKVRNATARRTGTMKAKGFKIWVIRAVIIVRERT